MTTTIKDLQTGNGGYYNRGDDATRYPNYPNKNYDKHVFIAGRILQSAEMNEIQDTARSQIKSIADALFKDGDIVRDARCIVEAGGAATLESGAVYANGQIRGVPASQFTVPTSGTIAIGVWLVEDVVTDTDDKDLLDPATGTRGFNEPGAYRLRVIPQWGIETDNLKNGTFYPVYYVDNGDLRAKEPPPNLDAVTQAIARYDVDSNGSNYVINGLRVSRMDDDQGLQVYSIASGRARVNGFGINLNAARRFSIDPQINLKSVTESYGVPTDPDANNQQYVKVKFTPLDNVTGITVLQKITTPLIRSVGSTTDRFTTGMGDVDRVISVKSGSTTLVPTTDYIIDLNNGTIEWVSNKVTSGSTYNVETLSWMTQNAVKTDDGGFIVTGGVKKDDANNIPRTVRFTYTYKLPRIDRLVIDEFGKFNWIYGVATDVNPVAPPVPSNLLSIAEIRQAWTANMDDTLIYNNGVRMVSMSTLEEMNQRLDSLTDLIAQVNLISDINVRDAGKKNGLFVDPFLNDEQRDASLTVADDLAIAGGCLQLAIKGTPLEPQPNGNTQGVTEIISCDYQDVTILGNQARTSEMKINPYMAFGTFPSQVVLAPQIDRWVETRTTWTSAQTRYFTTTVYAPWTFGSVHGQTRVTARTQSDEFVTSSTAELEYLRQIPVRFTINGFRPGENLTEVRFDDQVVTFTP